MGGVVKSAGGFLGLSDGPKAPDGQFGNLGLQGLNSQNDIYGNPNIGVMGDLSKYANGGMSSSDILSKNYGNPNYNTEAMNALATNPVTGSKFATEQVQNNPILGGLYGQGGQLNQAEGKLTDLQNQGFELKPEDQTLYGQESGNIARMFGQQGNQAANSLANRGLSSSGAAGAQFSGLAGNQNEMLAQAQQQIAQQRFTNTMGQIGQYQNFVNSMGANANNAIGQQYGRQASGAAAQKGGLSGVADLQQKQNDSQNQYAMGAAGFNVSNTPTNFMDLGIAAGAAKAGATAGNGSLFNGGGGAGAQGMNPGMQKGAYQNANGTINPADSSAGLA